MHLINVKHTADVKIYRLHQICKMIVITVSLLVESRQSMLRTGTQALMAANQLYFDSFVHTKKGIGLMSFTLSFIIRICYFSRCSRHAITASLHESIFY